MTIAVTGGTGFVGQALIDRALSEGRTVRALARSAQEPREGVEWIAGDLDDRKALRNLVSGAEAVVHVAGLVNAPDAAAFEKCNVVGTLNLAEAALGAGATRFVFVSSLSAREPELSAYGASKARAEKIVRASPLDWTIVRPPAIYGPRDKEMFELFRSAKWGVIPVPAKGRASVIHVDDLARLLLALLSGGEDVSYRTIEPDDGRPNGWSHEELARAIGWAMGKRRPRVLGLSQGTMELAARADGVLRRDKAKLTLDRARYFSHPDWVVTAAQGVPDALWKPRIETRAGLETTAQWYREQGWL
ncbi:epimerase [Novosphingobium marinum]|uniref:Nucleoside-diphosphate-sugar epimerase n=1 Tax=Novosphingobium marinum TaxID=1514948 RepID=A0A7Y9XVC1_9SPHN|nr:NAD(P)-dependent oxidoreductase [Novosphingobium marinum]NYH95264.1 nucleoside-diphosphate-sugar epimerase [Novosphingobium marinum]GGC25628.1 epimerase [Novosphingobium marinum]